MLVGKQIRFKSSKNEIIKKLFAWNHMYINLNVCKKMTAVELSLLYSYSWNYITLYKQMINSK